MNIIYIWIEQYKTIKKKGFLFRREYTVDFQYDKMNLSVSKNTESIDELLYGKNIDVTAIVGNNGVGKSTALDFVREILFNTRNLEKYAKGFILWEHNNQLFMFSFMNQEIKVTSNIKIEKDFYLEEEFGLLYYSDSLDLKDYNNMFDDGEDEYTYPEEDEIGPFRNRDWIQYNISTTYLVKKNHNNILGYFHEDIKKQLQLYKTIKENVEDVIPFPIPKMITFYINDFKPSIFNNVLDDNLSSYEYMGAGHHGENNTNSYTIGLLQKLVEIDRSKTIQINPFTVDQLVQWDIFLTYLYNQLAYRKENFEERDDYSEIDEELQQIFGTNLPKDNEDFLKKLSDCFTKVDHYSWNKYKNFYDFLKKFRKNRSEIGCDIKFSIPEEILSKLRETMLDYNEMNSFEVFRSILAEDNSIEPYYMKKLGWNGIRAIDELLDLFTQYSQISYYVDFLQFSWGMSTGENALFCLFARIFDVMKKKDNLKSVILLLDELDGSYHPKWQQRILKSLIDFIQKQFSGVTFQIVLTTHSPVLLSDIPKDNIVFMNNQMQFKSEIEHEQTFAANIATLYYDSFFMEDGSIGEIAKNVIGRIIDTINETNKKNIQNDDKRKIFFANRFMIKMSNEMYSMNLEESTKLIKKIKRVIDNIGEDFWRYKITEQFNNLKLMKEDTDIEKVLNEIKKLENIQGEWAVQELFKRVEEEKIR